jgi:hypothetical protein
MVPTSLSAVVAFLLFVAPGLPYQNARRRVLERAGKEVPSLAHDALRQVGGAIVASSFLTAFAVSLLLLVRLRFRSMPDPQAWIAQGSSYIADHLSWVAVAASAEFVMTFIAAYVAGNFMAYRELREDELLAQPPNPARPYAVVQLKSGTVYSGFVQGYKPHGSVIGKELILGAPVNVEVGGVSRALGGWSSIALSGSEIANLCLVDALDDGTLLTGVGISKRKVAPPPENRLYLYSEAQRPPWLQSDLPDRFRAGRRSPRQLPKPR